MQTPVSVEENIVLIVELQSLPPMHSFASNVGQNLPPSRKIG